MKEVYLIQVIFRNTRNDEEYEGIEFVEGFGSSELDTTEDVNKAMKFTELEMAKMCKEYIDTKIDRTDMIRDNYRTLLIGAKVVE